MLTFGNYRLTTSRPADADGDNVYVVIVQANDGSITADRSVTVTVTNKDEPGAVSLVVGRRLCWDGADG